MNVSNNSDVTNDFNYQLLGIAGNTIAVFGLVANCLSIVVLSHPKIRSSTSYYLITLAVYDNIILLAMELFFNLPSLPSTIMKAYECYYMYYYIMPIGYPISLAAQMGSIYTTVAFTIERYIAVCRPLDVANTCTKSRARKTMVLILLLVILYNIPRYFQYQVYEFIIDNNNNSCYIWKMTDFGSNYYFRHIYLIYFHLFFMFLIPFSILLVLNVALIQAVKRSQKNIQKISRSSRTNDNNMTVMLISVIIVFLVCQLPSIADNIMLAIVHSDSIFYQKFYAICTFMVEINSAVNFLLYCVFGKRFRTLFLHIFGLKKIRTMFNQSFTHTVMVPRIKPDVEMSIV